MGKDAKKVNLVIRVTPKEMALLRRFAKTQGVSLAAYVMAPHRDKGV